MREWPEIVRKSDNYPKTANSLAVNTPADWASPKKNLVETFFWSVLDIVPVKYFSVHLNDRSDLFESWVRSRRSLGVAPRKPAESDRWAGMWVRHTPEPLQDFPLVPSCAPLSPIRVHHYSRTRSNPLIYLTRYPENSVFSLCASIYRFTLYTTAQPWNSIDIYIYKHTRPLPL